MNTRTRKAIILRSRPRNNFVKEKNTFSRETYYKQRNYGVKLRKRKPN